MFTSTVKVYKWIERYEIILNHCIILQYSTRKIQHTSVAIVLNCENASKTTIAAEYYKMWTNWERNKRRCGFYSEFCRSLYA